MNKMETYIERYRNLSFEEKKEIVDEINSNQVIFENFKVEDNWNDYLYDFDARDIIKMTVNGEVDPNDEYIRFDNSGNLESLTESQLEDELDDYAEKIITELINNFRAIERVYNFNLFRKIFEGGEEDE